MRRGNGINIIVLLVAFQTGEKTWLVTTRVFLFMGCTSAAATRNRESWTQRRDFLRRGARASKTIWITRFRGSSAGFEVATFTANLRGYEFFGGRWPLDLEPGVRALVFVSIFCMEIRFTIFCCFWLRCYIYLDGSKKSIFRFLHIWKTACFKNVSWKFHSDI